MTERYFQKFPLISYNGYSVVNITERAVIINDQSKNAFVYYPYDLQDNERADQLANKTYDDEYMSWLVYMSNGITDPYYDWYMDDDTFNQYLLTKYGSLDTIQSSVLFYRNNWYGDNTQISPTLYNSLPIITKTDPRGKTYIETAKKYYDPVIGPNRTIIAYKRKRIDSVITTNRIIRYTVAANASFNSNEPVNVSLAYHNQSNVYTYSSSGVGQVVVSNTTSVTIQHTTGIVDTVPTNNTIDFTSSNTFITGAHSNNRISAITTMSVNIAPEEVIYWSPVTVYDGEYERNTRNKTVQLVDPAYAQSITDQLTTVLSS